MPHAVTARTQSAPPSPEAVDRIFARWTAATPGCAVGVAVGGKTVLTKAYGMADLEHDAPNTPDTIFEAGSVAKQFTAMAILLLAADGKLSLDDPVRKHVPELADYGAPLTIRHLRLPRIRFPKLGIGATIVAVSTSITQAYSMVYVEPFKARGRQPLIFNDVDLEGRDPKW